MVKGNENMYSEICVRWFIVSPWMDDVEEDFWLYKIQLTFTIVWFTDKKCFRFWVEHKIQIWFYFIFFLSVQ